MICSPYSNFHRYCLHDFTVLRNIFKIKSLQKYIGTRIWQCSWLIKNTKIFYSESICNFSSHCFHWHNKSCTLCHITEQEQKRPLVRVFYVSITLYGSITPWKCHILLSSEDNIYAIAMNKLSLDHCLWKIKMAEKAIHTNALKN